jgi:pimeloyl-ACP methyl ester carboxylesterase
VVADMARVSAHARALHPGVPLLLAGHSMGSFAAQLYVLDHHHLISVNESHRNEVTADLSAWLTRAGAVSGRR